jgi:RNA polymerase sigma-70 factor (ECF subfamily)
MMDCADSEKQVLAKAKAGDAVAFQQLLIPYAAFLSNYISRQLNTLPQSVLDPDDILQDVFLDSFRSIGQFEIRSSGSLRAWLQAIAHHRVQDGLKSIRRTKRGGTFRQIDALVSQSGRLINAVNLLPEARRSPSSSVARREVSQSILEIVGGLPADYRRAVELRILEGKSLDEVALIMGRTSRSIQGLIDRSKKKMREDLAIPVNKPR